MPDQGCISPTTSGVVFSLCIPGLIRCDSSGVRMEHTETLYLYRALGASDLEQDGMTRFKRNAKVFGSPVGPARPVLFENCGQAGLPDLYGLR